MRKPGNLNKEKLLELSVNCTLSVDLGSVKHNCESLILCKFMVVSAMSDNHFQEATDFIASVQTLLRHKFLFSCITWASVWNI